MTKHFCNVCIFYGKTLAATPTADGRDSTLHCLSRKNQELKSLPSGHKQQKDYQYQRLYNKDPAHEHTEHDTTEEHSQLLL